MEIKPKEKLEYWKKVLLESPNVKLKKMGVTIEEEDKFKQKNAKSETKH